MSDSNTPSDSRTMSPEQFAEYLKEVEPRLLAVIRSRLGEHLKRKVEAEDILQEVNADALAAFGSISPDGRDLFPWLCQLVERKIVDSHRYFFGAQKRDAARERPMNRNQGSSQADFLRFLVSSLTTPSQAFSRQAREAKLEEAIAGLSDAQQQAVRMRYVEGLPSKEIADALGKSDAAVRVMLTRTLRQLQSALED